MRAMTGWHIAHFLVLGTWLGVVLAELVFEAAGSRTEPLSRAAALFHGAVDRYLEIPLLAGVVLTGGALLSQTEFSGALGVKIACGLGAVAINGACAVVVFRREKEAKAGASPERLAALTKWVWLSAAVGVPLGLVALFLGGQRVGWW